LARRKRGRISIVCAAGFRWGLNLRFAFTAVAVGGLAALASGCAAGSDHAGRATNDLNVPTHADVQRALGRIVDGGAPGAAAVIQGPHGLERFSAGSADVRRRVRISSRDHSRVGSVTKSFTATVALKLVAQGKIGLEDSVEKWLPGLVRNGEKITIRQLLNMTSGLADYCAVPPASTLCTPQSGEMGHRWSPRRLVMIGASAPATFAPGQGWSYTNTGYVLLGMIVERATGKPIGAEYQSKIFGPLDLHSTRFPTGTAMPAPYSRGYDVMSGSSWPSDVTATSPTIAWSAGGIVSTPGDLATFMRALLAGRLLPPALLREMKLPTPGSLNGPTALEGGGIGTYGLGLIHYTWSHACGVWGHSGDFPGYHTLVLSSGDGKRGAAMYVNSDALAPPGALATLEAERLLACRMRFGRTS
jgi:D-alanyl-D-alanine carboxypeptidase